MKRNLITGLSYMLAASLLLYACQKEVSPSKSAVSLSASTTNAATGEEVALTVANMPVGTHLIWSSTNMASASFSANAAGSANVSFSSPGTYTVTAYIVSGEGADSIPYYDTTQYPHDTTLVPYPPHDTIVYNPGDTITGYPHDTVPNYPDTTPAYPHDTMPGQHDTVPYYPHDTTPGHPHDTAPGGGWYDSTHHDSLNHPGGPNIIQVVHIVITVH